MDDYFSRESFADSTHNLAISSFAMDNTDSVNEEKKPFGGSEKVHHSIVASKNLTVFERSFLENLLQSEDLDSIRKASERLADKELFPPAPRIASDGTQEDIGDSYARALKRRESEVQQELFRLHESVSVKPSTMLRRMSTVEREQAASRARQATASTPLIPPLMQSNSIVTQTPEDNTSRSQQSTFIVVEEEEGESNNGSWDMGSEGEVHGDAKKQPTTVKPKGSLKTNKIPNETRQKSGSRPIHAAWNPFGDVNSWIDGNQGVEVDGDGIPTMPSPTSNPFKILGTSADDVSAHPHVLTPPLMESLQQFMPESLQEYHFWLKYSLVRDASAYSHPSHPPLLDMLRHCRASSYTVIAIETTEGNVFGAFCSQPWRMQGEDFWGTKDSFVWRMRRSRNETCESIVEQVLMESKIDVFPFTGRNGKVQQCSQQHGLVLGEGEEADLSSKQKEGEHYGNAIRLNAAMTDAWTSTCETFGSPCLVDMDHRGDRVDIANVELWALTPHQSIESAITAEMKQLFLAENRGPTGKSLDIFEIIAGGPV